MKLVGLLGAFWGVAGFGLLLVYTIVRLTPIALEVSSYKLLWFHWVVLIVNTALLAYYEGYRGFQKGLSPRLAARAKYLHHHPNILHALLGPLFCMGYFHTTKRRQISIIALNIMIIILVILVRLLEQPWRGIVDVGVIVGLSWGLVASVIFSVQAFTSSEFDYSPEIPGV